MEQNMEIGKEILYLTYKDVVETGLTVEEVYELVEGALAEHGKKSCEMPAKIGLHPLKDTLMHAMPAFVPRYEACGIKWASCFPENYRIGLPQTSGLLILNDENTGFPIAVMDAIWITAKRTAAVTAVACKHLARDDSKQLGIIGTGVQGREHLEALPKRLPKLERVKAYDIRAEVLKAFVEDFSPKLECEVVAAKNYREAVEASDVIVSATVALRPPDPQIKHEWIKKSGVFIAPIEASSLWEFSTMESMDKFLVDSIAQIEILENYGYFPQGLPSIYAELGQVVCGAKDGRESDAENIIDMNVGMAVEDVVVAKGLYLRALERGIGTKLPL